MRSRNLRSPARAGHFRERPLVMNGSLRVLPRTGSPGQERTPATDSFKVGRRASAKAPGGALRALIVRTSGPVVAERKSCHQRTGEPIPDGSTLTGELKQQGLCEKEG